MRPALEIAGAVLPLSRRAQVVGRPDPVAGWQPEIDLSAADTGHTVSRRHAEITCDGSAVTLRDLGGPNGTFIDGVRMPTGGSAPLGQDSDLRFGELAARYVAEATWPDGVEADWERSPAAPADVAGAGQTMIGPRGAPAPPTAEPGHRRRWPRLPFR